MPDLTPGVPSALSPLVRRVVAPNPGLMTGPGTNTYLIGIDEVAVVDPGPADAGHVQAIVGASMAERVRWVLLTHTHPDHWPAATMIKAATGAEILGFGKWPKADGEVVIDRAIGDGDVIEGTEWGLQAIHTPGHAPNHLCFFLEEERVVLTGDHVLNPMTTVVNPKRGGDMAAYMASLERLRAMRRVRWLLPAHGDVIEDVNGHLDIYLEHRKARERQILRMVRSGPAKIPDIVAKLYVDTPEGLMDQAAHQVYAHLLKLKAEGKVSGSGARGPWKAA